MKCWKELRRIPLLTLPAALLFLTTIHPSALAQDQPAEPTIRKDSIVASVYSASHTEWTPRFDFDVNRPITKEDRFWVEAFYPGRKNRLTADCDGNYAGEDTVTFHCKTDVTLATLNVFVGLVDFEIHMANELYGKHLVLFRGKMKVVRGPENKEDAVSHFHVDEDWRIPIGYLSSGGDSLSFEVWWFGEYSRSDISFHLFHEGKAIARADVCSNQPVGCRFRTDHGDPIAELSPGAYEIKVLKEGRLKRTATFTVNEDGSFDNGIASASKLGSNKVIIPVNVVGDLPRPWNNQAWKTDAFYGNPLTGFTVP